MGKKKLSLASRVLIGLQIFLGAGAIFGGGGLVLDPSGELIMMPIELLDNAPFDTFLYPGIILLIVLGIAPLVISYGLITKHEVQVFNKLTMFKDMHWSWMFSLYIGFALIIWITMQVWFINAVSLVHVVYIGLGLLIQAVTMLPSVRRDYNNV